MKKVISLILIAAMLLGALPVLASAQTEGFTGYTLSLGESIAVEFYAEAANVANFEKVVFYKNDEKLTEITSCPAAEEDGCVYFKFSKLGPHEMDASIKAELYLTTSEEPVDTKSVSVLDYCKANLGQDNEKLSKLLVDMLNYGAAAQTYTNNGTGISDYIATLDETVTGLGASGNATVNALSTTVYERIEDPTVSFTQAALVLNSGIVPSFTFTTEEDVSGLTAVVSCAGKTWEINSFQEEETASTYTFDFYGMNPSQVRSWIFVTIQDAQGNPVSHTCAFTAEHYTANAAESEQALTSAMMHYGDAVKAYVTRDITESVLTDEEKAALSALTPEQFTAAIKDSAVKSKGLVSWAYGEAGIDVSASFDLSVFYLTGKIFSTKSNVRTVISPESSSYTAKYGDMLVDGYIGGTQISTGDHEPFIQQDFQVGDVFCAIIYKTAGDYTSSRSYKAGVYLGDGKFLMSGNTMDSSSIEINTELVFMETLNDYVGTYFVLSPEQLAPRADGELTVALQRKLSALTLADLEDEGKTNDTGALNWICEQYGIDKWNKSVYGISNLIFDKTNGVLLTETSEWMTMLVRDCYGGSDFNHPNQFTAEDFKVGDIFCARNGSEEDYVALYLGDGNFLTFDEADSTEESIDTTTVFSENLDDMFDYYFVLRPSQYIYSAS